MLAKHATSEELQMLYINALTPIGGDGAEAKKIASMSGVAFGIESGQPYATRFTCMRGKPKATGGRAACVMSFGVCTEVRGR